MFPPSRTYRVNQCVSNLVCLLNAKTQCPTTTERNLFLCCLYKWWFPARDSISAFDRTFFFLEMNWAPNFRWKSPENKLYPMKQWNETRKSCNLNNMLYLHEERNHLAIHTYNIIYKMRCTQRQPSNEWTQQIKRDTRAHASIFHIDSAHKYRYGRLKFYRALYNHFERVSVCLWCIYEWEKTDTTSTSARSNWQRVRSQAACALTQPKRKKTSLWK